jgi:soluble lytic murein transglycosylase-like protein
MLAATALILPGAMAAQSLQPTTDESGHTVWTNDPGPGQSSQAEKPQLCYWSNKEQRWKPVRKVSPRAIRTARAAAGEVDSYLDKHSGGESSTARRKSIDKVIDEAAARHHVDPNLVRALVKVESNFNPSAVSRKGAMGLMQLMPQTARLYDINNPFDPEQNVDAGVRHLKGLLENFGGDVQLSLAAYNAGQGAVERNRGIPPYTETRNYVKRITALMGGNGADSPSGRLPESIQIRRDENGRLIISNWE